MIIVDSIAPSRRPAIAVERVLERFRGSLAIRHRHSAAIEQHRQLSVVGHPIALGQNKSFDPHSAAPVTDVVAGLRRRLGSSASSTHTGA